MEYTVKELAKLSGVSSRTLRYYDQIGLLKPQRIKENGYRVYGPDQVERLQHILFYREMAVGLEEIGRIMESAGYDSREALEKHLQNLLERKVEINRLIDRVSRTIGAMKGEYIMSDKEKFESFKETIIRENEQDYGEEVREKFGDETIDAANQRIASMTEEQWEEQKALEQQISLHLKKAVGKEAPKSAAARELCMLHGKWITMFWPKGAYSKEAHLGLCRMYVEDERFKKYYDNITPGAAEFLLAAMEEYCG